MDVKSKKFVLDARTMEGFVKGMLFTDFDKPSSIPDCHREWWSMCLSGHPMVAIASPRGHGKSTAITFAYTLACIVFRRKKFVLIVSDTEGQSIFFLDAIKRAIETNEDLRNWFEIRGLVKSSATDIIIEFMDGSQARVIAKGSEQKIRGLNWNGTRPDLIMCDDMENDEIVMNKDRREKFQKWFTGALLPCRSVDGEVRIIGTILHMDSLLESYMPNKRTFNHPIEETKLKQVGSIKEHFYSAKYKAHPSMSDFSEILWRSYKSKEWLQAEQAKLKATGRGDAYAQEYLNEPIDESNSLFSRSDFLEIREEDRHKPVNYYISMDLAVTQKTVSDYTVFVVAGIDEDGRIQIRDIVRQRLDSLQIVDTLMDLVTMYDPQFLVVEKGSITNSLLPAIKVAMYERNVYFDLHLMASTVDKVQRSGSIRNRMRSGMVKFDKDSSWFEVLESECLRFPRDRHDDQVDALSLLGMAVNKYLASPSKWELEQKQYNDELEELEMDPEFGLFSGQSQITGY